MFLSPAVRRAAATSRRLAREAADRPGCTTLPDTRHRHAALPHDDPVLLVNLPADPLRVQTRRDAHRDGGIRGPSTTRIDARPMITRTPIPRTTIQMVFGIPTSFAMYS